MSSREPTTHDFTIYQGADLSYTFFWYDGEEVIKAISAITNGYPPVLTTSTTHGLPTQDMRAKLKSIAGPTILNTVGDATVYVRKVNTTTFSVPSVNTCGLSAFVVGCGYLIYTPPKDLTSYTALMHVRRVKTSSTILLELDDPYTITIGGTEGTVSLELTAEETAALDFNTAFYDLELTSPSGVVTRLAEGTITLSKEVTR